MNYLFRRSLLLAISLMATPVLWAQDFVYNDSPNPPGLHVATSDNQNMKLTFSVDRFSLENIDIKGEAMKNIVFSNAFVPADEGMPNVPSVSRYIAIPNGSHPVVKVTSGAIEYVYDVDIAPAPRLPLDNDPSPLFYEKNVSVYSKNAYYPESNVLTSEVTTVRGVQMVMVAVTPFRYNAVARRLELVRDLTIDITFQGGNGQYGDDRLRSRWWDPIISDMVLNPEVLPEIDYNARIQESLNNPTEEQGAEYLIIRGSSSTYAPWADSIKNWRVRQGITTMVKTVDEVGGNTVTAIESYLNNAYNTWTTPPAACLLIGDYGTDGTINIMSPIWNNYCVSDNIYADVDNDQMPDIVMARITANNEAQLATMASKGLNYERNPPTSAYFYSHPITALGWQTERWFQICSETVGGYFLQVQGKTPVRINEIYSGTPSSVWSTATNTSTVVNYFGPGGLNYIPASPSTLGGWSGGNATMINNALNAGAFILQHRDHGGETGWGEPDYTNTNINGLTNTDLSFIFSINCLTGKYNWSNECFTEKFHRYTYNNVNSGALGLLGASEVSYSFVNDTYVWGVFDNMWPDFMPAYGTTPASRGVLPAFGNAAGKYFLQQSSWPYNTNNKEVTYNLFHMHGDAFMQLFSEVPQNLIVTHAPVLYAGVTTFQVTAPIGSFIALTVNNTIIGTGNGTGSPVNITIPAQVPPDQVIVTATKQNYRRYTGYVNVVPAAGPYIVYDSHTISDPTGNNNGQMDFGEANSLNVGLKNVGVSSAGNVVATITSSDTYVTITDNNQSYGNIGAGATVVQNNAFALTVANNIPDQHVVNFAMSSVSGASTWNSSFSVTANAPALTIGALSIDDSGSGCNNDGILDPGETANIVVSTTNSGHALVGNAAATLSINGGTSPYLIINNTSSSIGTLGIGLSGTATFNVTASSSTPLGTPVDLTFNVTAGVSSQYSVSDVKQVVIGLIPTFIIGNTTVSTCTGYFLDSGGETGSYQNNENYTMTFNPGTANAKVKATFLSFSTEGGYDYLYIYNGPNTSSPQVSGSPFNGNTSPGTIQSTHSSGALTFRFTSDNTQVYAGWKAQIQCIGGGPSPVVNFSASQTSFCAPGNVTFTDLSSNTPTSWSWSFPGGTPTTSSLQNPSVTYPVAGNYDVTLISTNQYGQGTLTKTAYIQADGTPAAPSTPTGNTDLCLNPVNTTYSTNSITGATGYTWQLSPSNAGIMTPNGTTVTIDWDNVWTGLAQLSVKATGSCGDGSFSQPLNISVSATPSAPIQPSGLAMVCHNTSTQYNTSVVSSATEYIWTLDPVSSGTLIPNGTLCTVNWGAGYTGVASLGVKAINTCGESPESTLLDIDVSAGPLLYTITGGGSYCEGASGVDIGLDGSESGINYSLLLNGSQTGSIVTGTGSAITFGSQTSSGTYSVTGTSASCEVPMNGSSSVSVKTAPQMPSVPLGPDYIDATETPTTDFETTGSPEAVTYAWKLEPAEAGSIEGNSTTGTAVWGSSFYCGLTYISVSAVNECGESGYTEAFAPQVDNFVSVSDLTLSGYKVYPIPAQELITIESVVNEARYDLVSSVGQTIQNGSLTLGKNTMTVSNLASGIYLLKITGNGKTVVSRIMVSK